MPHISESHWGSAARDFTLNHPTLRYAFVPTVLLDRVELVVVMCSSFSDPGEDWVLFIFYDNHGEVILNYRMKGY